MKVGYIIPNEDKEGRFCLKGQIQTTTGIKDVYGYKGRNAEFKDYINLYFDRKRTRVVSNNLYEDYETKLNKDNKEYLLKVSYYPDDNKQYIISIEKL